MRKHYSDVVVSEQFISDFSGAPEQVKKATDKLLHRIGIHGALPPSMRIHKAATNSDVWIGYVTRSRAHWRVLFYIEDSIVRFDRLMKHDEADIWLRKI